MLTLSIDALDRATWQRHAGGCPDLALPQSWAYGEAKVQGGPWHVERGVFHHDDGSIAGTVQVLLRPLPLGLPGGLAWVGRGPLRQRDGDETDPRHILTLLAALRRHYVAERGFYLRVAPPVADDGFGREAPPGFARTVSPGWASARINLTLSVEALRAGLQQKWRNVLNKAERGPVIVEPIAAIAGSAPFAAFLDDYRNFLAERQVATSVTPELLRVLAAASGETLDLMAAHVAGAVIGWALIARSGGTAEYLAGVVGEAGRRHGAGQSLLWQAMVSAKSRGCAVFDVGGLDPIVTPEGIRRFKEGLGGVPYRLTNEIEAVPAGPFGRLVRWRVGRARAAIQ